MASSSQQPSEPLATFTLSPSFSPLYQPSATRNLSTLANLATLTSVFAGTYAGILGLKSFYGFGLYILASAFNAICVVLLKTDNKSKRLQNVLPSLHAKGAAARKSEEAREDAKSGRNKTSRVVFAIWEIMAVGQENILTFLLFWIGIYVSFLSRLCLWLVDKRGHHIISDSCRRTN